MTATELRTRPRHRETTTLRRLPEVRALRPTDEQGRVRQPTGTRTRSFVFLFAIVGVLNVIGLIMILSASTVSSMVENEGSPFGQFLRQSGWLLVGILGMVVALRIDYRQWQRLARPAYLIAVGLLLLLFIPGMGRRVNGARRWIGAGPVQIQPAEFAKLALLLFVADLLARRSRHAGDTRLTLRPVLVVLGVVIGLVMLQPNFGTSLLIFFIVFAMLVVAGVPGKSLVLVVLLALLVAAPMVAFGGYRTQRLMSFRDAWDDPLVTDYQNIQSQVAFSNGEITGAGVGQGRAKYGFLPEADTDFIYAVIGEETGFLGACVVIGLFLALGAIAVKVALNAPDRFGMLVATGIAAWILFQAFVNMGVTVGALPNTGVPLPFVSVGGSALLFTMIASGILLNIARHTP